MDKLNRKFESLATQGVFGDGSFLRVVTGSAEGKGVHFQSQIEFLRVDLVPSTGKITKVPIVVKTQPVSEICREENASGSQFMNEVMMYKDILPALGGPDLCPELFHGEANNLQPDDDVIILSDLRSQGYNILNDFILDKDHVELAMKKLGQLHGLSYKMKLSSPEKLVELSKKLIPKLETDNDRVKAMSLMRGLQPVVDRSPSYSVVRKVVKKITETTYPELISSLMQPEEPFAVICHGDYNANNLMFKYNDDGKVVDVKIVDFGYASYSDPTFDISFCLCMNVSSEIRTKYWDVFLDRYWEGVTSVAGDPGFSKLDFLRHFSGRAIVGYAPCSFFLPMMMDKDGLENMEGMSPEETMNFLMTLGGEKATATLSSIVSDLLVEGCLDAYLRQFSDDQTKGTSTPGYTNITFNFA